MAIGRMGAIFKQRFLLFHLFTFPPFIAETAFSFSAMAMGIRNVLRDSLRLDGEGGMGNGGMQGGQETEVEAYGEKSKEGEWLSD